MSSRRERRRKESAGGVKGKWAVRLVVGALVTLIVVFGGGYFWLGKWLHGEGFRRMISDSAGDATRTKAEFGVFNWSGTLLTTPSFVAEGDSLVRSADAKGLKVDVGIGAAWHGVLQIDDARARSIDVVLDTTAPARKPVTGPLPEPETAPKKEKKRKWYDRFVPHEVEVKQVQIDSSSLKIATKSGTIGASGIGWKVEPDQAKGSYKARAAGGKLILPWSWAPPMELGVAQLRYAEDTLFLSDADFSVYRSGRLNLTGEMSVKGGGYEFDGELKDVDCSEVLEGDWKKRISGHFETGFHLANPTGKPHVEGRLILSDAVLTALPLLDTLSAYADTTRFRRLALQEASCAYDWEDGALKLRNLVLSSEGLVRLEGSLSITKDKQIDGVFRLGLVPGVLSHIPGAETDVFLPGERGLLWTPLRVSGTLDHPKEDLTDRLIEAAGARMFEVIPATGEKVLKFTEGVLGTELPEPVRELPDAMRKGAETLAPDALRQGKELLDTGKGVLDDARDVARDAGDIFDIIRGKEPRKAPAREDGKDGKKTDPKPEDGP